MLPRAAQPEVAPGLHAARGPASDGAGNVREHCETTTAPTGYNLTRGDGYADTTASSTGYNVACGNEIVRQIGRPGAGVVAEGNATGAVGGSHGAPGETE